MPRTSPCTAATRRGRLSKAAQFADAAATIEAFADQAEDVADAYVTLLVHAGIAAADVMCCARLGEHAAGDNHNEAAVLLGKVDRGLANDLRTLLGMKTKAGYSALAVSSEDRVRAGRASARLLEAARLV
ncbi:hypothetical protein [Nocardioides speluncae]|uniref:hypothetical protein n=1 Tax=Nocardioides speluncae TaxID=2670337 RepID=UPI000D687750|nr:hypothetical protein [Nocardioides speluncae]